MREHTHGPQRQVTSSPTALRSVSRTGAARSDARRRRVRIEQRPVALGDGDAHALQDVPLPTEGSPAAPAFLLLVLLTLLVLELELGVDLLIFWPHPP